jgi:hypothetical protein
MPLESRPLFPLGVNDALQVNILAEMPPPTLKAFKLTHGFIISTSLAPPHWMVLLVFTRHEDLSQRYTIIAERVLAHPLSNRLTVQSSQILGHLSHPTTPRTVNDHIKGYNIAPKDTLPPSTYDKVTVLSVNGPQHLELTLLDVATVLSAVSQISVDYILTSANCWWFARTVGLTLELLASKIPLPSVSDAEAADATTSAAAASAAATAAIAADLTSNAPAPTNTPVRTPPAPPATPEAAEVEEDFLRRSQQPLTTRLGDREISADVAHILTTFVSQVGVAFVFTL